MKTLGLDEIGDLTFEVVDKNTEIMQSLEIELGSQLGEWFLDEEYGVDGDYMNGKVTVDGITAEVARIIANEERVQLVSDVSVDVETSTRKANVYFKVQVIATGEELELGGEI